MEREEESEALRMAIVLVRLQRGRTQKEVAEAVGMAPSTISGYEHGHRPMSRTTAERIVGAMGVSSGTLELLLPSMRVLHRMEIGKQPTADSPLTLETEAAIEIAALKAAVAMRNTLAMIMKESRWKNTPGEDSGEEADLL